MWIFTELIYRPILNITVGLYNTIGFHDLGVAIIAMTLLIRVVLLPLSLRTARSQRALAALAPRVEEIKKQHKGNMTAQNEAVMKLYKEEGVSPLAGCLPLLIQFPILIGTYRVFINIFHENALQSLYGFVYSPETINHLFLGLIDISKPVHWLAILTGFVQFAQAKMSMSAAPAGGQQAAMNTQMMYLLPLMIVVVGWNVPAGLPLYWITTTAFSIGEQLYLRRSRAIIVHHGDR